MIPLLLVGGFTALAYIFVHSWGQLTGLQPSDIPSTTTETPSLRFLSLGFLKYINAGGSDETRIAAYQKAIGAPVTGDPDEASEKRIEQILGYNVSWRPTKKKVHSKIYKRKKLKPKTKSSVATAPKTAIVKMPRTASVSRARPIAKTQPKGPLQDILSKLLAPKTKAKPPKKTTAKPITRIIRTAPKSAIPAIATESDDRQAAKQLDEYLRSGGLDRSIVKSYQSRMGGLVVDGVAGPKTKARAESLLGRTVYWPANDAADQLHTYYVISKGRDKATIKKYQTQMGELAVDGSVGPKTKTRYKSLTGKAW